MAAPDDLIQSADVDRAAHVPDEDDAVDTLRHVADLCGRAGVRPTRVDVDYRGLRLVRVQVADLATLAALCSAAGVTTPEQPIVEFGGFSRYRTWTAAGWRLECPA